VADEAGYRRGSRDRVRIGVGVMARAPSSGGKTRIAPYLSESRLRALRCALLADTLRVVLAATSRLRSHRTRASFRVASLPASDLPLSLASNRGELPPSRLSAAAGQVGAASLPAGRDGYEVIVFVEPGDACGEVEALSAGPVTCVAQSVGDLGRRMCAAFTHLLQPLRCDAAILVGSDIPLLTADHLDEARETLATTGGVVLGPADDGGYYLIGMRTVRSELFEGIAWGTNSVLTDTLRIAERAGIEARLIRAAYDVDTIEDLHRLESDLRAAPPDVAPDVRAWFSDNSGT
jgi:rSAM/selenodomain-associated transferase 1